MAKRDYTSQMYAEDKDVYDVLASTKRAVSQQKLLELAQERGIFLSDLEDRDRLVDYISRLPFDWHELKKVFELVDTPDRMEKLTSSTIATGIEAGALQTAIQTIQSDREASRGEVYSVRALPNHVEVEVRFTEMDPSKTRINQRRQRQIVVRIETSPGSTKFRYEANGRAQEIVDEITKAVQGASAAEKPPRVVELAGIRLPQLRTRFFEELMTKMAGFKLNDVRSVSVDRLERTDDDEPGDDTDEDADEAASEVDVARAASREAAEMTSIVRSALLRGEQLLGAKEYKNLEEQGFFITHAVWLAEEQKPDGALVEFEAEFADGPEATGFRYGVRGIYPVTRRGAHRRTRGAVGAMDRLAYVAAIEDSAQKALATVEAAAGLGTGPSSPPSSED